MVNDVITGTPEAASRCVLVRVAGRRHSGEPGVRMTVTRSEFRRKATRCGCYATAFGTREQKGRSPRGNGSPPHEAIHTSQKKAGNEASFTSATLSTGVTGKAALP